MEERADDIGVGTENGAPPRAGGRGWGIGDYTCVAGPDDRPFEERHESVSIAAVVEGSFTYVTDTGRFLMHPGALLLGNHAACYQCGHDHGVGDRCVAVHFSPDYFAEIAATAAGASGFRFPVGMLPARRDILPYAAILAANGGRRDPMAIEVDLIRFTATAMRALSGAAASPARVSALDERRVGRALRHIERHADDALDLDRLAGVAAMSKFHFLRVFRRAIGVTPYQFLLNVRLRRAASRLLSAPDGISTIAYESGFGDLSTFNAAFRARFGLSPGAFRAKGAPA